MRSPTLKRCSGCAARLTRSTFPIRLRFFHGRVCAVKNQGSTNLIHWKLPESRSGFEMAVLRSEPGAGAGFANPWNELRAIAGEQHLRAARTNDEVAGVHPQMVLEPGTETELAAALRCGNAAGLGIVPRGG